MDNLARTAGGLHTAFGIALEKHDSRAGKSFGELSGRGKADQAAADNQ